MQRIAHALYAGAALIIGSTLSTIAGLAAPQSGPVVASLVFLGFLGVIAYSGARQLLQLSDNSARELLGQDGLDEKTPTSTGPEVSVSLIAGVAVLALLFLPQILAVALQTVNGMARWWVAVGGLSVATLLVSVEYLISRGNRQE